jgi:hypothetical protein
LLCSTHKNGYFSSEVLTVIFCVDNPQHKCVARLIYSECS